MNNIELKSVRDVSELSFFVPYYQRGYRWKVNQVQQLLHDINAFQPTEQHPFYFLQALAVAVAKDDEKTEYHVVDGQQRLTTLQLILEGGFHLEYDRGAEQAIDLYYKVQAKECIDKFFKSSDTGRDAFCTKVLDQCRFLYYEVPSGKELQTFTELNSGKIPAKDSELVKCLLLSPGADENAAITQARATEWDVMERKMQNDAFFAFMTPRNTWREEDRMTVLFRYAGFAPGNESDEVFPFLMAFQNQIAKTSRLTVWKQICAVYYRLIAWFDDPLMYHAFGWYVHRRGGSEPKPLDRGDVLLQLNEAFIYNADELGDDYKGGRNNELYRYLLLHNVAFCWRRWPMRYDFIRHRQVEAWSIEHIFARNQRDLESLKELISWLPGADHAKFEEYRKACKNRRGYDWLAEKLGDKYPKDDDNTLKNLAMLPKDANSSLNNGLFEEKRKLVIGQAEKGWTPYWVPPVTEAVFLKSLPGLAMAALYWSDDDKKTYQEHMASAVNVFVDAVNAAS